MITSQGPLLTGVLCCGNIGHNIIVPSLRALQLSVNKLDSAIATFNNNPGSANLTALQNAFKAAYKNWQSCAFYDFGPAELEYLRVSLNTFPIDSNQINKNINSGSYNLAAVENLAAVGFPGVDFMLFGTNNNTETALYTTDSKAAARKQYLAALSNVIKTKVNNVTNSWTSTYINTFISASGTDQGSSLGQLVNQLAYDLDVIKNDKLGIPLGKQTMGAMLPQKTEGYYSGISAQLVLLDVQGLQNVYLGKGTQGDGQGLDDYLVNLNAQYNSVVL